MALILQTTFLNVLSWSKTLVFKKKIIDMLSRRIIGNESTLIHENVFEPVGIKSLMGPMLTHFRDVIWHH